LIILFAVILIFLLLLLFSVKIVYNITVNNFDFSAKIAFKFPFVKEMSLDEKTKKEKKQPPEKKKQEKKKVELKTLNKLGELDIGGALTESLRIITKHCKVISVDIKAKAALPDPMENGIAFGIISGVLNIVTFVLKENCRIENVNLEILSDFNSGEGLIFESHGTLRVRPFVLAAALLFNRKLIKNVKVILKIIKEEKENG